MIELLNAKPLGTRVLVRILDDKSVSGDTYITESGLFIRSSHLSKVRDRAVEIVSTGPRVTRDLHPGDITRVPKHILDNPSNTQVSIQGQIHYLIREVDIDFTIMH